MLHVCLVTKKKTKQKKNLFFRLDFLLLSSFFLIKILKNMFIYQEKRIFSPKKYKIHHDYNYFSYKIKIIIYNSHFYIYTVII